MPFYAFILNLSRGKRPQPRVLLRRLRCRHHFSHFELDSGGRWDLMGALPRTPGASVLNAEDWALDLELMHYYGSMTCNTISWRENICHTWRVILPIEVSLNKYVMYGILAIASLHKAYLYLNQKIKYIKASAYHLAVTLKEFRELITSPVDHINQQPVLYVASLICIHISTVPIQLGVGHWPNSISNMVRLFTSIKGFQEIIRPFLESLQKTKLVPLVGSIYLQHKCSLRADNTDSPPVVIQDLSLAK
ncbi:hypothetical protein N7481_013395 [Penicillium waksmanii]|uniref:uncharacterized protein n=1 Tax=Penicillium waksmanii TaxID=69791 RepID=UPI0025476B4A|nr:uncharacterized protein N7481_013395 [Penicillium waksmanii]KAJ5963090.1 hypothetical protein N7481_013395 [Penicillium waksmanii]